MKISMKNSDAGVDFLAMRIVIVLLLVAVLIAAAAAYVEGYTNNMSRNSARQELTKVAEAARSIYVESCPDTGDSVNVDMKIPESVRIAVFGGLPGNNTTIEREPTAYYLEYKDGSLETYVTNVRYAKLNMSSGNASDEPVVIYPGGHSLRIELRTLNDTAVAAIAGGLS